MLSNWFDILFRGRESPIFQAAELGLRSIECRLKEISGNIELEYQGWVEMFKNDPHSPRMMKLSEKPETVLIYYPKNSTPYLNNNKDGDKKATILKGELFAIKNGEEIKIDTEITVNKNSRIIPYTRNSECYVYVERKRESLIDQVC